MSLTTRQQLIRQIEHLLVPALVSAGFQRLPLSDTDKRSVEIRAAFPLGRFRRRIGDRIQQIEVQFDKNNPTAFRLNFGSFTPGRLQHPAGPISEEDVWVHYLPEYNALYDSSWRRRWFTCALDLRADEADCRSVVLRVVSLLPQVEQAFDQDVRLSWRSPVHRIRAYPA